MKDNNGLLSHFSDLKDPRVQGRTLHPAMNIIYITIVATLCGVKSWEEIEDFAENRAEFFSKRLDLSNGIPSHDTINRFFQVIDRDAFQKYFISWTSQIASEVKDRTVSIDGKTICCASKMSDDELPIHIVSAWASENRMVLGQACLEWQKNKDKQENEIVAIPKLIEMLELEGCTVTMDAIGTQTKIVEKIVEKNADYVLAVKGNQPTLHDDIARYFDAHPRLKCLEDTSIGHGRIETRRYCLSTDLSYLSEPDSWKKLAGIVKVTSETVVKKTGEKSSETRYYITSLTKTDDVASSIRKHWGVESMHWILDVTFNEDHSMKRAKNAAYNYNSVCKIALNILKNDGFDHGKKKLSIPRKMLKAMLDEKYLTHLLSKL